DILDALGPEPGDLARGQDHLETHDVVAGDTVFQSAETARVVRDVAAYGRNFHRAGIGRVKKPERGRRVVDRLGDDPALAEHREIRRIDFEDAVEMDEAEDDAALHRDAAARESGPRAAGDHGDFLVMG